MIPEHRRRARARAERDRASEGSDTRLEQMVVLVTATVALLGFLLV